MSMESLDTRSRELNSTALVPLDPDSTSASLRAIQEVLFSLRFLGENIQKATLEQGTRTSTLGVAESQFARLCKLLGYDGVLRREEEARHVEIRGLNQKIHELEEKLGQANLTPAIKQQIEHLHRKIERWWKSWGFCLVRESGFGRYRYSAEFSGMISDHMTLSQFDDAPVSGKQKAKERLLKMQETFELVNDGDRDWELLDCEKNREALRRIFREAMPSTDIHLIESWCRRSSRGGKFTIRGLKAMIDVDDIIALPDQPKELDLE